MMRTQPQWPRRFVAQRALFNFFGATFRIFVEGRLGFFVRQKAFRLKEEIIVHADLAQREPRLRIQARNILDIGATYDVSDTRTGERVGSLRRRGIRSLVRDTWDILGPGDAVVGTVREERGMLAILSRLIPLIPQSFVWQIGDVVQGTLRQRFHLFRLVYDVDLRATHDPRLGLAMAVLLLAIERRQR